MKTLTQLQEKALGAIYDVADAKYQAAIEPINKKYADLQKEKIGLINAQIEKLYDELERTSNELDAAYREECRPHRSKFLAELEVEQKKVLL